jgi:hypothetical protein
VIPVIHYYLRAGANVSSVKTGGTTPVVLRVDSSITVAKSALPADHRNADLRVGVHS